MAAKVPIALAHGSVPSAFASHEDVNGTLNAITLPQALALLDLTADHTLAAAAATGPPLDLSAFNELVASLFAVRDAESSAATALQARQRGVKARSQARLAKKKKKKVASQEMTGDLDATVIVEYLSGLGVSAASGELALLELKAPSLQLQSLSGLFRYPALTSVDVSSNKLRSLSALTALSQLSWLSAAHNDLKYGLDFSPAFGGSRLRYVDLRKNNIVTVGSSAAAPAAAPPAAAPAAAAASRDAPVGLAAQAAATAAEGATAQAADAEVADGSADAPARSSSPEDGGGAAAAPLAGGGVAGVAHHPQLQTVLLDGNRVTTLAGVEKLTNLSVLSAEGNRIRDASALYGLQSLRELDLSRNQLGDPPETAPPRGGGGDARLQFLPSLPALCSLKLSDNGVRELPPLSGLKRLSVLDLFSNQLSDAEGLCRALHGAGCLRTLEIGANPGLAFEGCADLRLLVLHRLPTLTTLDGATVSALEKVAAHNLHGEDSARLRAIRQTHMDCKPPPFSADARFPGAIYPTLQMPEMPELLEMYQSQYTAKFNGFTTQGVNPAFTRGIAQSVKPSGPSGGIKRGATSRHCTKAVSAYTGEASSDMKEMGLAVAMGRSGEEGGE
jgi:Leucine-rich repeat (LRR) protein